MDTQISDDGENRPQVSQKKRWYKRKRLWALALTFFLAVSTGIFYYVDDFLNSRLASLIPAEVHELISIGSIRYNLWNGKLKARNLVIADDSGNYTLTVGAVHISVPVDQIWAVTFLQTAEVSRITIVKPSLTVKDMNVAPQTVRKEKLLQRLESRMSDEAGERHDFHIFRFRIRGGSLQLTDPPANGIHHRVSDIELEGTNFHSLNPWLMSFDVKGKLHHNTTSDLMLTYRPAGQKTNGKSGKSDQATAQEPSALSGRAKGRLDLELSEPVPLVFYNPYMAKTPYFFKGGTATSNGVLWLSLEEAFLNYNVIISSLSVGKPLDSSMSLLSGFFVNPVLNSIKAPDGNVYVKTERKIDWQGNPRRLVRIIKSAVEKSFYDKFDF